MKSLIAASAATLTLLATSLTACGQPAAPRVPGIRFTFEAHDRTDTPISTSIEMTIKASALNPDLFGAFEDPDSGISFPFRDPVTRVDLPITLPKHTPYGAPVYYPPGEIINFIVTAHFFGRYGDVVLCMFKDMAGNEISGTRRASGVYDQLVRDIPSIEAPGEVTCQYSGEAR
jgi:hypothetical protein